MRPLFATFLLIVALGTSACTAQDALDLNVETTLQPLIEHFPGMAVVVADSTGVIYSHAVGLRSIGSEEPYTTDTASRVYSVSKPWTAAGALTLVERGRLTPSTTVGEVIPGTPQYLHPITVYQLATHTSGIRHYENEAEANSDMTCRTPREALPIFVDDPLLFDPGSGRQYSSWAFVLLSALLAERSDQPFDTFMNDAVFGPLGMEGIRASNTDPTTDSAASSDGGTVAVPYTQLPNGAFRESDSDVSCKFGAGGFLATAGDLASFYYGLLQGRLLSEQSRDMLLRPDELGRFMQQGVSDGGRSQIVVDVSRKIVATFTANAAGNEVEFNRVSDILIEITERVLEGNGR